LRGSLKRKIDDFPEKDALKTQLAEKQLFAFVYEPLVNPLNDKVVGATYSRAKGIVRVLSWDGSSARVTSQDEFTNLAPSDVVSVLHTWENREVKPLTDNASPEWWTTIGDQAEAPVDGSALAKGTTPLAFGPKLSTRGDPHVIRFQGVESARESQSAKPLISASSEPPPLPPAIVQTPQNYTEILGPFIVRHHEKSSAGNVEGLMLDYAERVDHYDAGVLPRDAIRAEELKYHAPGYRITERVRGRIELRRLSSSRTEARYQLIFLRVKPDNSWATGAADVVLEIEMTSDGPLIVKQNSVSRENEKQRGQSNPPSL